MRYARSGALTVAATLILAAGCGVKAGYPAPDYAGPLAAGTELSDGIRPEVPAAEEPLSTFAIDIDTASYYYARQQILDGRMPAPDTVRPEEFINAFRQDYQQPSGHGFTVTVDGARIPEDHDLDGGDEGTFHLLRVGLQTKDVDPGSRPDAALTFVIDVSGSMSSPDRLGLVQDALHLLIDQLRPTDAVAIVAYNDEARVLREMTRASSRRDLHAAVDQLKAGGSTNLEGGLVLGYQVARKGFVPGASNRVILLSDGLANVGNTEAEPILERIRKEPEKEISLLGVGVGSQYGDALMERLADEGDGFVTYVSERKQARELFVNRLPATLVVRALDAKVQVDFNARVVASYRLVGYDNRVLSADDFRDDRVDGGEVGPGHSVTALYVVRLHDGAPNGEAATVRVRWLDPVSREASETTAQAYVADLDRPFSDASPRLQTVYAAAFFAEVLRQSPYGEQVRLRDLAAIAAEAAERTEDEQIAELADLIGRVDDRD